MDFDYQIIRSARKTLAIQVDVSGNVLVRSPLWLSEKEIERFLLKKQNWIDKAISSQKEKGKAFKEYSDDEIEALRRKAKEIIPLKVLYYSEIMGVKPKSIRITSARKRFGSCSGENSLNFSLYLLDKDERFIDYVVVHELAHIKHHDHSADFYSFVARFMPDYKERERL